MRLTFSPYGYIAAFALMLSATVWVFMRGYNACEADYAKANLKRTEVNNEIRNRPHDASTVDARWLRGTF